MEPDVGAEFIEPESGSLEEPYFLCAQAHTFQDVPEGYTVSVRQGAAEITDYTTEYADGTLKVYVENIRVGMGQATTITVTVTTANGDAESVGYLAVPELNTPTVTAEKTADGEYTFRVVANVTPAGASLADCWGYVTLDLDSGYQDHFITLTKSSDGSYVGTVTVSGLTGAGNVNVDVYGEWMGCTHFTGNSYTMDFNS